MGPPETEGAARAHRDPRALRRRESVVKWFDGRVTAELRLWEALERGFLSPFQYFGVHDGVDLSNVRWTRGGYDLADLEKLYTGKRLNATKRGCLGPTSPTAPPR